MLRSACFAATVLAALSACKMANPAFEEGSESADAGESATTKASEEGAESQSGSSEVSTSVGDGDGDGDPTTAAFICHMPICPGCPYVLLNQVTICTLFVCVCVCVCLCMFVCGVCG